MMIVITMLLITTFASQVEITESNIVRSFKLLSNFSCYICCYRSRSTRSISSRSRKGASSTVVTVVDISTFL